MIRALRRAVRRIRFGEPIIVVSGLPRSGTSMMMQMLAAGGVEILTDDVRGADESNPRGYYEFEPVKSLESATDVSWLRRARGRAVKIIAYLLEHLPRGYNYRVVFMLRALDEVLDSQRAMLQRLDKKASTDDDHMSVLFIGHIASTRRLLARRPEFEVLYVRHDQVLAGPTLQARSVAAFLRRELDTDAMADVVDPALHRSRSGN